MKFSPPPLFLNLINTSRWCYSLLDVLVSTKETLLTLQHEGGSVVVEGYFCCHVTLWQTVKLVLDKRSLSHSSVPHKHHWLSPLQQQVHEVPKTHSLCCVYQNSLQS